MTQQQQQQQQFINFNSLFQMRLLIKTKIYYLKI